MDHKAEARKTARRDVPLAIIIFLGMAGGAIAGLIVLGLVGR